MEKLTNLIDLIEGYWAREWKKERNAHYPSDASDCMRALYWKWMVEPVTDPILPTGFWRMNIGNSIHTMLQRDLKRIALDPELRKKFAWDGFKVTVEESSGAVPIDGQAIHGGIILKHPMRYRTDLTLIDEDGAYSGADFKTTYGAGVRRLKDSAPEDRALVQVLIYIMLGGFHRFYVPYISRDDGDRMQFVIQRGDDGQPPATFQIYRMGPSGETTLAKTVGFNVYSDALRRLQVLEEHVDGKVLPDRGFRVAIKNGEIKKTFTHQKVAYKSDWQCSYCAFKERCWAEIVASYSESNNSDMFADQGEDSELADF